MDAGRSVAVSYYDLSKAFDKIDHNILLSRLQAYMFPPVLVNIIKSFLINRTQCVSVSGSVSPSVIVTSGVPQGSVLGPILFIVYINDIFYQHFFGTLSGYVDDLKLLSLDGAELKYDTDKLLNWVDINKLSINVNKCSLLCFESKKPFDDKGFEFKIGMSPLPKVSVVKDLGIHIDSKFSFRIHVDTLRKRSYGLINLCFRIFSSKTTDLYILFYKTYVIPRIVYCSSLFGSSSVCNINQIERIQRFFSKRLYSRLFPGCEMVPYLLRLGLFQLEPLECRLYKIDLLNMYRILNHDLFTPSINVSFSPRCPNRLCVSRVSCSVRKFFFLHRTIMLWNRYLAYSALTSLSQLKSTLSGQTFASCVKGSASKAL